MSKTGCEGLMGRGKLVASSDPSEWVTVSARPQQCGTGCRNVRPTLFDWNEESAVPSVEIRSRPDASASIETVYLKRIGPLSISPTISVPQLSPLPLIGPIMLVASGVAQSASRKK
jgi:hypothetical protein